VEGGPDIYVDEGSMVNLSCVVAHTSRPPTRVVWTHDGDEISFRGPRDGVSVSESYEGRRVGAQERPFSQ